MNVLARTSAGIGAFRTLESKPGTQPEAAEVVVMWNETCIRAEHLNFKNKKTKGFTIGEDPTCDFPVPAEYLNGASKLNLLDVDNGLAQVRVPAGVQGEYVSADGSVRKFADLFEGGGVQGIHTLPVINGAKMLLEVGPFTFLIRPAKQTKYMAPYKFSFANNRFAGLSLVAHVAFFALVALVPPDANGLISDPNGQNNRFSRYMIAPVQARLEQIPEILQKPDKEEEKSQEVGKAHRGLTGAMGDRHAKRNNARTGIKGPADIKHPVMARDTIRDMASAAGILQYLSTQSAPVSPFGAATALGRDPENALGGLMGDTIGNSIGYGHLGVYGTGIGGGGDGDGTFGVGTLGYLGPGYGKNKGQPDGLGRPKGKDNGRRSIVPTVHGGTATVKGSLSKAVIRRHIQRQRNQIKYCYEKGLAKNAGLEGRVSVRFMIERNGSVKASAISNSTVGNAMVEQCIAHAVGRITFPPPQGGIVIVTYPFILRSPNL